jgi:hypothetical protein
MSGSTYTKLLPEKEQITFQLQQKDELILFTEIIAV